MYRRLPTGMPGKNSEWGAVMSSQDRKLAMHLHGLLTGACEVATELGESVAVLERLAATSRSRRQP